MISSARRNTLVSRERPGVDAADCIAGGLVFPSPEDEKHQYHANRTGQGPDPRVVSVHSCLLLVIILSLVAGCASGPPPLPVEVRIPVAVPCIAEVPVQPELLTDRDLAALDDYRLVLELARDRRLRQGYEAELEAVVAGCR